VNLGDRKWGGGVDQGADDPPRFTPPPPPPAGPAPPLWRRILGAGLQGVVLVVIAIGWIILALVVLVTLGPFNPW
jgi:hypothetical protein